jgi:hypothetical protein
VVVGTEELIFGLGCRSASGVVPEGELPPQFVQFVSIWQPLPVYEPFELPLWEAWGVVNSDLDQAVAYLAEALAAYRQGYVLHGDELPPSGWFATIPKLDEQVRLRVDKLGPSSDVRSTRSHSLPPVADPASSTDCSGNCRDSRSTSVVPGGKPAHLTFSGNSPK